MNQREDTQQIIENAVVEEYSNRHRGARIALPNGRSVPMDKKYMAMRYPGIDSTLMLGSPESMLKSPRKGAKYVWKNRKLGTTAALIRQQVLRPVGVDEVDTEHPYALFQRLVLAGKPVVAWESLILCEMPPHEADRRINVWADYAISNLVGASDKWKNDVATVSHGQMKGTFEVTNPSSEG